VTAESGTPAASHRTSRPRFCFTVKRNALAVRESACLWSADSRRAAFRLSRRPWAANPRCVRLLLRRPRLISSKRVASPTAGAGQNRGILTRYRRAINMPEGCFNEARQRRVQSPAGNQRNASNPRSAQDPRLWNMQIHGSLPVVRASPCGIQHASHLNRVRRDAVLSCTGIHRHVHEADDEESRESTAKTLIGNDASRVRISWAKSWSWAAVDLATRPAGSLHCRGWDEWRQRCRALWGIRHVFA
jgi:hypothetical protein